MARGLTLLTARLRRDDARLAGGHKGPPQRPDLAAAKAPLVARLKQAAQSHRKENHPHAK